MGRKQRGIFVDEDAWRTLKVYCTHNNLNVVDKAGEIVEKWVSQHKDDARD